MRKRNKINPVLTNNDLARKTRDLALIRDILIDMNLEYYIGGAALLGMMREGKLFPWCTGLTVHFKFEDYIGRVSELNDKLASAGFLIGQSKGPLNQKTKVFDDRFLFELTPWHLSDSGKFRIRKHSKMPSYLFTPGCFRKLSEEVFQVFNPPENYLCYRYGEKWRKPINSRRRHDYETAKYNRGWKKLKRLG